LGDIPEDYDQASFEMERLPMITEMWRPKLSIHGDALKCHNQAKFEKYFGVANMEAVKLNAVDLELKLVRRLDTLVS